MSSFYFHFFTKTTKLVVRNNQFIHILSAIKVCFQNARRSFVSHPEHKNIFSNNNSFSVFSDAFWQIIKNIREWCQVKLQTTLKFQVPFWSRMDLIFFVKVEKHIQISDKKMLKMDSAKRFEHWFARIQVYRTREINTDIYRKKDDIADKGACSVVQLPGRNPDLVWTPLSGIIL